MSDYDYIKREDAHNSLRALLRYVNREIREMHGVLEMIDYGAAQRAIDRTPASDVRENVRGKFVGEYDGFADGEPVYDIWRCSCCGMFFEDWDEKPTYNFCPNCGAQMEEGQR